MRLKWTIVIALALLVGVVIVGYDYLLQIIWDGGFVLKVHLSPKGDRPITQVSARAYMDKELEAAIRFHSDRLPLEQLDLEPVPWVKGNPFTVRVPCSGQSSGFGRELSYFQYKLLVLRVEFVDGTSAYLTAEIPDGRVKREVFVAVP